MFAGASIPAGAGHALVRPTMDFETRGSAGYYFNVEEGRYRPLNTSGKPGLPFVGAFYYAMHHETEIVSLSYDLRAGEGVKLWVPGMPPPLDLLRHISMGGDIEGHNVVFEYLIWNYVGVRMFGWPELLPRQCWCSLAKCFAFSIPGKLGDAVKAMGLPAEKNANGQKLINQLSVPRKPTKADASLWATPANYPEKFAEFYQYNMDDVTAESGLSECVPELSDWERQVWLLDFDINLRGVAVDVPVLNAMAGHIEHVQSVLAEEMRAITGGAVVDAAKTKELGDWLELETEREFPKTARGQVQLTKERVEQIMELPIPDAAHRALEIRQLAGHASVKKVHSIRCRTSAHGRIHGLFQYAGADRTGRFAGRGPQPQNLYAKGLSVAQCQPCGRYRSAAVIWCPYCESAEVREGAEWGSDAVDDACSTFQTHDPAQLQMVWGDVQETIAACLRGVFVAGPGMELVCSDFSAIEAVVAAAIADEQWRLEVFKTHGMIYEAGASKLTGVPFQEFVDYKARTGNHHPHRKKIGKVSELASGYGGWIPAWRQFGADEFMDDQEIKEGILAWRAESPNIVEMWGGQWRKHPDRWQWTPELFGLEGAAVQAIQSPGQWFYHREIGYVVHNDVMFCRLPSGRYLHYHQPRLEPSQHPAGMEQYQITYMGRGDPNKGGLWMRLSTYGGKLFENVVQAIARDIQANSLINVTAAGFPVVLHVHDEIVSEVPAARDEAHRRQTVDRFEAEMSTMPWWAEGWPVKASGGWMGRRFRKD